VNYLYFCIGSVVVVENLGNSAPTTADDAQALMAELEREGIDLRRSKIVYRDANRRWARLWPPSAYSKETFGAVFPVYSAQFRRAAKVDGQKE
jgi:predicted alpha/beta-hydrolase family hydrolase